MNSYSIIVFGAGPSGICAAIHASNCGLSTLLVEPSSVAGGAITLAGVAVPALFNAWGRQVIAGIGWELVKNTLLEMGEKLPDFMVQDTSDHVKNAIKINPLIFSAIADEAPPTPKSTSPTTMMPQLWNGSLGRRTLHQGRLVQVRASVIIDCTGDANATKSQDIKSSVRLLPTRNLLFHATATNSIKSTSTAGNDFHSHPKRNAQTQTWLGTTAPPDNPNWVKSSSGISRTAQEHKPHLLDQRLLKRTEDQMDIKGVPRHSVVQVPQRTKRTRKPYIQPNRATNRARKLRIVGETTVTEDYTSGRIFRRHLHSSTPSTSDPKCGLIVKLLKPGIVPTVPRGALIPKTQRTSSPQDGSSSETQTAPCESGNMHGDRTSRRSYRNMAVKLNQQPREIPIQAITIAFVNKTRSCQASPETCSAKRYPFGFASKTMLPELDGLE